MLLQFKADESIVQAAWLKTLYDLIDELNCRCVTYIEEVPAKAGSERLSRVRTVDIYGTDVMISWLKLRMERYLHFIDSFNSRPEIKILTEN